jgi:hypothetical protein
MQTLLHLWLPWILVNTVATATSMGALRATIHAGLSGNIPEPAFVLVWIPGLLWAFAGGVVGGGQWLVLRRVLPRSGGWVWASAVGAAVSVAVMFLAFWASGGATDGASALDLGVVGAAGGAALGAVQWLVLRRLVHRAGWWVPANAAGVGVGALLYILLTRGGSSLTGVLAGGCAGGAAYGLVTGTALFCLLRTTWYFGVGSPTERAV